MSIGMYDEEKIRKGTEAWMISLAHGLVPKLNNLYATGNTTEYNELLRKIQNRGILVLRNGAGKHILRTHGTDGDHDYTE